MNLRIFIFAILIFTACGKETTYNYYYSDGTIINDEKVIKTLISERDIILSNFETNYNTLNIYTTLNSKLQLSIKEEIDSIYSIILDQFPDQKKHLDSLIFEDELFKIGILAVENKTGKIIFTSSNRNTDQINGLFPLGNMTRLYEFTLAMDKDFKPDEYYPLMTREYNDSINDFVDIPDTMAKINFHVPFSHSLPSPINDLSEYYKKEDFINLFDTLNCNYRLEIPGISLVWSLSLKDVTKTLTVFKNKGYLIEPYLIDIVSDANGSILYKTKIQSKKILNDSTTNQMMTLLEYFMNAGMGSSIRYKYHYTEPIAGRTGRYRNTIFWLVTNTEDLTIGIRFTVDPKKSGFEFLHGIDRHNTTIPIWYKTLQMIKSDTTLNYKL